MKSLWGLSCFQLFKNQKGGNDYDFEDDEFRSCRIYNSVVDSGHSPCCI